MFAKHFRFENENVRMEMQLHISFLKNLNAFIFASIILF